MLTSSSSPVTTKKLLSLRLFITSTLNFNCCNIVFFLVNIRGVAFFSKQIFYRKIGACANRSKRNDSFGGGSEYRLNHK